MAIRHEILSQDGQSVFRVEDNGKIRLILKPEDRPILVGYLSENDPQRKILILYKTRTFLHRGSYTLAVPEELLTGIAGIKVVALHLMDRKKFYCATSTHVKLYGYENGDVQAHRQKYLFLDPEHWREVADEDGIFSFEEDERSRRVAESHEAAP